MNLAEGSVRCIIYSEDVVSRYNVNGDIHQLFSSDKRQRVQLQPPVTRERSCTVLTPPPLHLPNNMKEEVEENNGHNVDREKLMKDQSIRF